MLFITTGGTIDKMPAFLPDAKTFDNDSKVFKETHLPEMLKKANFLGEYTLRDLFMVDSLDMTDEHREQISETIKDSAEEQVVITHGTDTMPETAKYLERNLSIISRKTIVLTGAMIPYKLGVESDAMFNIGNALAYAQALPSGVYVAMNGEAFDASNVRKDLESGTFKQETI